MNLTNFMWFRPEVGFVSVPGGPILNTRGREVVERARSLPFLGYRICELGNGMTLVLTRAHLLIRQLWMCPANDAPCYRCHVPDKHNAVLTLRAPEVAMLPFERQRYIEPLKGRFLLVDISDPALPFDPERDRLNVLPMLLYPVEQTSDGHVVCIGKPGSKLVYRATDRLEDFIVWVCDPMTRRMSEPAHKDMQANIWVRSRLSDAAGARLFGLIEEVCNGLEPNDISNADLGSLHDEAYPISTELLLKVAKWVFIQEDCSYPPPLKGRRMELEWYREALSGREPAPWLLPYGPAANQLW